MFVYYIVKITRLHDYQTWPTHISLEIHEVRVAFGPFFLDCAFRALIGWAGKLQYGLLGKYRFIVGRRVPHVHSPLLLFLPHKMPSLAVHSSGKSCSSPAEYL